MANQLLYSTDGGAPGFASVSADSSVFCHFDLRALAADFNVNQLHQHNVRLLSELNFEGNRIVCVRLFSLSL